MAAALSARRYSRRKAIIGFTFAAHRAGIQQAASATSMSSAAINVKVSGSVALALNLAGRA